MKLTATILGILLAGSSFTMAQEKCVGTPPDGMSEIAAFSIFQGNYSGGDYAFSLRFGRWLICTKPDKIEGYPKFNLSTQYPKFIKIYTEIGLTKEDPSEKEAYIDTALALYEESFKLFAKTNEEKYDLYQSRGRYFLENYRIVNNGLQRAYQDFGKMFELNAEKTTNLAKGYYIKVTIDDMVRNDRKNEVIKMIETATPFANPEIVTYFDEVLGKLFNSPEERLTYCGDKLKVNPNDIESLKCVAKAQEALNMQKELIITLRKIHKLAPTYDSALSLADIEKGNAKYKEAAVFYKEALKKASNPQAKKEINIDLSDVYASMGELSTAKKYIQDALKVDANYGLAYIKLASIYGQAVSACSDGRKLEAKDKVVYWVVVDYLNKAKRVDASVTNTVNSQLSTYEAVTPSTEDKFFTLGYKDAQSVKVDGSLMKCYSWINETTTVR